MGKSRDGFLATIDKYLSTPLHPAGLAEFKASLQFHPVNSGEVLPLSDGVSVHSYALSHPGGAMGYRMEYRGKSLCYCTDIELADHRSDTGLENFTRNADC